MSQVPPPGAMGGAPPFGMPPAMGIPPGAPGMMAGPMGLPGVTFKKPRPPQPLSKWADVPPNNTLYVNNLNEKVNRRDIVNGLREVFSQFGDILDIICYTKIRKCKGQAWIVFDSIEAAKAAREELQEFAFYNKPLHVHFAKEMSDATRRRDGQPIPERPRRPKRNRAQVKKQKEEEERLKKEAELKRKERSVDVEMKDVDKREKEKKEEPSKEFSKLKIQKDDEEFAQSGPISFNMKKPGGDEDDLDRSKRRIVDEDGKPTPRPVPKEADDEQKQTPVPRIQRNLPPNHTLFLEGLPPDCTEMDLNAIFGQCGGFLSVQLFPAKPGIGFCKFADVVSSTQAMRSMVGLTIRDHTVRLSYAAQ